jgi:hypothetical protein
MNRIVKKVIESEINSRKNKIGKILWYANRRKRLKIDQKYSLYTKKTLKKLRTEIKAFEEVIEK